MVRTARGLLLLVALAALALAPAPAGASAARVASAQASVPSALSNRLPLERLVFSHPVAASALPPLTLSPALPSTWRCFD